MVLGLEAEEGAGEHEWHLARLREGSGNGPREGGAGEEESDTPSHFSASLRASLRISAHLCASRLGEGCTDTPNHMRSSTTIVPNGMAPEDCWPQMKKLSTNRVAAMAPG